MKKNQGIALVTALVLMIVMVAVIAILTLDTVSEIRQNKDNILTARARNAAEAGTTYARMGMDAQLQSYMQPIIDNYATNFMANGGDPTSDYVIPENAWSSVASSIQQALNSNFAHLPAGDLAGAGSANISYQVQNFRISSMPASGSTNQLQVYTAEYKIVSSGKSGAGRRRVREDGFLTLEIGRASLSQWLFLVEDAGGQNGFFYTGSVFDGPVHANNNWGFGGQPKFLDRITASDGGAWYWDVDGRCNDGQGQNVFMNAGSRPPCTVPDFQQGYDWNAPRVQLPNNTLSQERAALGLDPAEDLNNDGVPDPVSQSDRCAQLGISPCTGANPVPDGVYLVNDGNNVTGGFYIEGDLDDLYVAAGGNGTQIYQFTQSGQTWTVVVDYNNNTTTVRQPSGATTVLNGVPNGPAPLGSGGPTGQIYVTGGIRALRAPSRTGPVPSNGPNHPPPDTIPPALSLETQLNITAVDEIDLYTDLIYECDPTQMQDASYLASHSRCQSVRGSLNTVLGLFSESEDITIRQGAVDDIYLWGSFLSANSGRGLAVENYDTRGLQGTMHLFGGIIQWNDKVRGLVSGGRLVSGYVETFEYDRRFEDSHLSPPNFPTTRAFALRSISATRLAYKEY